MEPNYQAAFNVLLTYWKFIPEDERKIAKQKLKLILGESCPFYKEHNGPSEPLSRKTDTPPKDCIKNAFKRLKDKMSFGIPD